MTTQTIQFSKPGLVNVFCNIHPEMALSILVLPNRAYAKPNAEGKFKISVATSGKKKIVAWHPLSSPVVKWVDMKGAGEPVDFELKLTKKVAGHLNKHGRPYKPRQYK
jgi:hypothetical protein